MPSMEVYNKVAEISVEMQRQIGFLDHLLAAVEYQQLVQVSDTCQVSSGGEEESVADAIEYMLSGEAVGKVVVRIGDP